jgi:hypothetical protein
MMGYMIKKTEAQAESKKNRLSAFFDRLYIADSNVFLTTGGFDGIGVFLSFLHLLIKSSLS